MSLVVSTESRERELNSELEQQVARLKGWIAEESKKNGTSCDAEMQIQRMANELRSKDQLIQELETSVKEKKSEIVRWEQKYSELNVRFEQLLGWLKESEMKFNKLKSTNQGESNQKLQLLSPTSKWDAKSVRKMVSKASSYHNLLAIPENEVPPPSPKKKRKPKASPRRQTSLTRVDQTNTHPPPEHSPKAPPKALNQLRPTTFEMDSPGEPQNSKNLVNLFKGTNSLRRHSISGPTSSIPLSTLPPLK